MSWQATLKTRFLRRTGQRMDPTIKHETFHEGAASAVHHAHALPMVEDGLTQQIEGRYERFSGFECDYEGSGNHHNPSDGTHDFPCFSFS